MPPVRAATRKRTAAAAANGGDGKSSEHRLLGAAKPQKISRSSASPDAPAGQMRWTARESKQDGGLYVSPAEMDERLMSEFAAHEHDFDAIQKEFYEQDEFIFCKSFFSEGFMEALLSCMREARPLLNRNYVPMQKQGGSVSAQLLRDHQPTFVNLYKSPVLMQFLQGLTDTHGELQCCPVDDAHSVALYFYDEVGDHIGYHYDTSFYRGNRYTMLIGLEDESSCELVADLYRDNPDKETQIVHNRILPGDLVLFNGDKLWHCVTPLQPGDKSRVIVTMEFVTDPTIGAAAKTANSVKDAIFYFGLKSLFKSAELEAGGEEETKLLEGAKADPGQGTFPGTDSRVVAFVNPNSGSRQGPAVLEGLLKLLGEDSVFDLSADSGPEAGLNRALTVRGDPRPLTVLACGGDGTIRWVIEGILDRFAHSRRKPPAIGVIPLGTGNDLSRELGWGSSFDPNLATGSNYRLARRVRELTHANYRALDLWHVSYGESEPKSEMFFNYFNVGFDPQVALSFHNMRRKYPTLFNSQLTNKAWYGAHAAKSLLAGSPALSECLELSVDGEVVPLPKGLKTIVLLNFRCYQAGADLWGPDATPESDSEEELDSDAEEDDHLAGEPRCDDGLIEVVGIQGIVQNALIRMDRSVGVRIARGSDVVIRMSAQHRTRLAMACDGEPFESEETEFRVTHAAQVEVLENS